jgi:hypothetical protein
MVVTRPEMPGGDQVTRSGEKNVEGAVRTFLKNP